MCMYKRIILGYLQEHKIGVENAIIRIWCIYVPEKTNGRAGKSAGHKSQYFVNLAIRLSQVVTIVTSLDYQDYPCALQTQIRIGSLLHLCSFSIRYSPRVRARN